MRRQPGRPLLGLRGADGWTLASRAVVAGTKAHPLTDGSGQPVAVGIMRSRLGDIRAALPLPAAVPPGWVCLPGTAYDSNGLPRPPSPSPAPHHPRRRPRVRRGGRSSAPLRRGNVTPPTAINGAVGKLGWVRRTVLDGRTLRPRGRCGEPAPSQAVQGGVRPDRRVSAAATVKRERCLALRRAVPVARVAGAPTAPRGRRPCSGAGRRARWRTHGSRWSGSCRASPPRRRARRREAACRRPFRTKLGGPRLDRRAVDGRVLGRHERLRLRQRVHHSSNVRHLVRCPEQPEPEAAARKRRLYRNRIGRGVASVALSASRPMGLRPPSINELKPRARV